MLFRSTGQVLVGYYSSGGAYSSGDPGDNTRGINIRNTTSGNAVAWTLSNSADNQNEVDGIYQDGSGAAVGKFYLGFRQNASYSNPFSFDSSGKLGIGTTSPFAKLSIAGSANGTTPLFAISTSTSSGTTTVFQINSDGTLTMNTTGATSTINGNLYVNGALRSTTSYNGDLIFANDFRVTESPLDGTPQGLLVQNQNNQTVFSIDQNGKLITTGDI